MKTPTTTTVVPDWAAIWARLETGEILTLEDMTLPMTRAFNMWARVHKTMGLKTRGLLTGGYQVQIGNPVPTEKRRYTKRN
jgi:hypothetical protein